MATCSSSSENGQGSSEPCRKQVIIGTVLGAAALWGRNGGGIGSILGDGGASGNGGTSPTNININGGDTSYSTGGGRTSPTAFEAYSKGCEEALALTSAIYQGQINGLKDAAAARGVDVNEKFQLWKSQIDADFGLYVNNRDNIDRVNNRLNAELFDLYKYTRDKDDETRKELCDLKAQVAVANAIRPYQDKLIMEAIEKNYVAGINYVDRKTCKMVSGVTIIPTSPTLSGYGSYCCGNQSAEAAG